jgi:predicted MPP superfamily phosphohydrolase
LQRRRRHNRTPVTLKPRGWPAGRKLTITVIADLHAGGPDMPLPNVQRIVDTANALKSDVIVMLGDYIARYRFAVERIPDPVWAAELARLQAPLGVWAILGNHDWWYDLAGVRNALAEVRIPLLENQAVLLGPEGERVWVAGIGDQIAYRIGHGRFRGVDDLPGTLAQVTTDDPVILLAHEPDIFPRVPSRVALTFAGHTHGGQIRVPLIWPAFVPSRYGKRYAYGHVIERERHLIVSGGLGTSIIPARFGVPPEIVHVTLGHDPEKWKPTLRKDRAPPKKLECQSIRSEAIALQRLKRDPANENGARSGAIFVSARRAR